MLPLAPVALVGRNLRGQLSAHLEGTRPWGWMARLAGREDQIYTLRNGMAPSAEGRVTEGGHDGWEVGKFMRVIAFGL